MPSHAANSRPLRKAALLPIAATFAVATTGPMPGIFRMRVQPASVAEILLSQLALSDHLLGMKSKRRTIHYEDQGSTKLILNCYFTLQLNQIKESWKSTVGLIG
jgi:hypothetical protein